MNNILWVCGLVVTEVGFVDHNYWENQMQNIFSFFFESKKVKKILKMDHRTKQTKND